MASTDWQFGTENDVLPSIVVDGTNVLQADLNPAGIGGQLQFDMFFKSVVNILNTELRFKHKVEANDPFEICRLWLRSDSYNQSSLNGILVLIKPFFSFPNWYFRWAIYKIINGARTLIYQSGNLFIYSFNTWYEYRLRVWDASFPAGRVSYTLERYSAGWVAIGSYDDDAGYRKGISGRIGLGALGGGGAISQKHKWDDIYIGEET